jgi:hypothetical protein
MFIYSKKSLKISKESVNRQHRKGTQGQKTIDKTVHIKLKIEEHKHP